MAKWTQASGRGRAQRFRGDPRIGASASAPTAPHATGVDPETSRTGKATGPAEFWSGRRVGRAVGITVLLSSFLHGSVALRALLSDVPAVEFKDVDGELTIPVDLIGEAPPPPPDEPPPPPAPPPAQPDDEAPGVKNKPDAAPPIAKADAAAPDAGEGDARAHAEPPPLSKRDAGGSSDAGVSDGGVASADASAPAGSGPRDPGSIIGVPGLISAGTVNVSLIVNVAVIRTHPVGARIGPLLYGIPQWNDFLKGTEATIDPIRDTDWILIYGPSLINTDRDAVIVRYSIGDDVVDKAVESIVKRYDRGSAFDAGVPGVKASIGHADNAERVFLRGQPHVLTIVPKDKAHDFAKLMKRALIQPKVRHGEALRLIVKEPSRQVAIPGLKFGASLKEIRLWVVPRTSDGGADVYVEGDCTDAEAATENAAALTDVIRRSNNVVVRIATRGLLNDLKVEANGSRIELHVDASAEQLEVLLQAITSLSTKGVSP